VVLVHGAMDRATSFTRLAARLADWTVVSYDRRGYSRSSHRAPAEDFDEQVTDFFEVLGDEPAVAFGHSFGGDVVLAAAGRRPRCIEAAVVWEPPQPWLPWWPQPEPSRPGELPDPSEQAERFMRRMVGDRVWDRLPSSTRSERRAEGVTLVAEMRSLRSGPVFDPPAISIPVIVGRGGRSPGPQRRAVRELAASLPGGHMADIPEAAHGAHLTHPAELARLITEAAAAAPPRAAPGPGPAGVRSWSP